MIKARVLFTFVDKITGEQRLEGSVVELEESRAAELKSLGAVSFDEEPKPKAKQKEEVKEVKEEPKKKAAPSRRAKK